MPVVNILSTVRQDTTFEGAVPVYLNHEWNLPFNHLGWKRQIHQHNLYILLKSVQIITLL